MHTCHAPFSTPTNYHSSRGTPHNKWPLRQKALNARLDARAELTTARGEDTSIVEGKISISLAKNDNIPPMGVLPRLVVIGGGAAGIFGALRAKEVCPQLQVTVLERAEPLSKVRISGGGRCNVTTGLDLQPLLLAKQYPRGHKELRGAFFRTHGPTDTARWFQHRGVQLKTEADGRMFPESDTSSTIIDCLMGDARQLGVDILPATPVASIRKTTAAYFTIRSHTKPDCDIEADFVLLATGSDPQGHRLAASLSHTLLPRRPSLFTFKVHDPTLTSLAGISFPHVRASLSVSTASQKDPTLSQKRKVGGGAPPELQLPRRFWHLLLDKEGEFKDEFVTAGGVPLAEIHLSRMESKKCPGLFLAGEVMNVDGVTGGYNFQNAWTGGFIAGSAIAEQAQALLYHQKQSID